jgi:hypothetical protein
MLCKFTIIKTDMHAARTSVGRVCINLLSQCNIFWRESPSENNMLREYYPCQFFPWILINLTFTLFFFLLGVGEPSCCSSPLERMSCPDILWAFFFSLKKYLSILPRLALNSWAQAILLPQPPRSWDYKYRSPSSLSCHFNRMLLLIISGWGQKGIFRAVAPWKRLFTSNRLRSLKQRIADPRWNTICLHPVKNTKQSHPTVQGQLSYPGSPVPGDGSMEGVCFCLTDNKK